MFWGLNSPRSIDAGRRNKGKGEKGKSMAEWNPAAIELFQLTLAEEKGGFQNTPCLLTHFFYTKIPTLLLPLHTHLSACQFFHLSLILNRLLSLFFKPVNKTSDKQREDFLYKTALKKQEVIIKSRVLYILIF